MALHIQKYVFSENFNKRFFTIFEELTVWPNIIEISLWRDILLEILLIKKVYITKETYQAMVYDKTLKLSDHLLTNVKKRETKIFVNFFTHGVTQYPSNYTSMEINLWIHHKTVIILNLSLEKLMNLKGFSWFTKKKRKARSESEQNLFIYMIRK